MSSRIPLLALLVCAPGCGPGGQAEAVDAGGDAGGDAGADAGADQVAGQVEEQVVVERGAPIDAPVEPRALVEEDDSNKLDRATAVRIVAAGIEDLESSNITVIDDLPSGELEDGVEAITWRALSLREIYGEHLRALLYPEENPDKDYDFPENIKAFDGKEVAILGYMIPLEWDDNKVPEFMLVRDLMGCCFGSGAQPDEWIDVRMVAGEAEYISYMPVVVIGKLSVGSFVDDAGYQAGCFHIDATSVQMEL